jgi:hypothetical protein
VLHVDKAKVRRMMRHQQCVKIYVRCQQLIACGDVRVITSRCCTWTRPRCGVSMSMIVLVCIVTW